MRESVMNPLMKWCKNKLKEFSLAYQKIKLKNSIKVAGKSLRIIIGAGITKQDGWISTNYPLLDLTKANTFLEIFPQRNVDVFFAEHVWEHLNIENGLLALTNCYQHLQSGGKLRIAVPDGFHKDKKYILDVEPGGTGSGSEDHKVLYNYRLLSSALENAGFQVILLEWFDEHGVFHFEDWDIEDGLVRRSTRFDDRNHDNPTTYTSLIIDALKP